MANQAYESLRPTFEALGQGHVFTFWEKLEEAERRQLLDDLRCVNLSHLPGLMNLVKSASAESVHVEGLSPAPVIQRETVPADTVAHGRMLISKGRVCAMTVAGGQGTRLGFDGPKGAFPISPVKNKTLFQLFAESILATERRYGTSIQWYIMTSPGNDAETQGYFRRNRFFGLAADRVTFFQQGVMPSFDQAGRILLEQKHRLALSPDGHGGSLLALATSGVLADMARRGIDYISYFQVDNPLVACIDPVFIGLHAAQGAEMSSKTLPKADDLEKVGNFAMQGGRQVVIEYSDLPESLARARNPDGSRKFDAGNIAIHILSRSFVERLTVDRAAFALPWHIAKKKIPHVDHSTGETIEPASPNGVKLEAFVFDALPLATKASLLGTSRAEEFSPVKNKDGVDSVETARRDMSLRAQRWLKFAGVSTPDSAAPDSGGAAVEISPLVALDAESLRDRVRSGELPASLPGDSAKGFYLG